MSGHTVTHGKAQREHRARLSRADMPKPQKCRPAAKSQPKLPVETTTNAMGVTQAKAWLTKKKSGTAKGVITKGVLSLKESLEVLYKTH